MRTTVPRRLLMTGVAVVALGALMSACGDSNNKTDTGSGGSTTTAATGSTTTAAKAAALTVSVKKNPMLGNILADPAGKTLYTLTDGSGKAVACTGACIAVWPALKLAAGSTSPAAPSGVVLKVVDGPNGTKLVATKGLPLYTFAADASSSDAKGEGLSSFGGTWHVVKTTAAVTSGSGSGSGGSGGETTTTMAETTTTASSTY